MDGGRAASVSPRSLSGGRGGRPGRLLGLVDSAAAAAVAAVAVGGHYGAVTAAMDEGNGRGPLCLIANKGGSGIELAASYVDSRTIHIQGLGSGFCELSLV